MKNLLAKIKNFKYTKALFIAIPILILFVLMVLFPGESEEQVNLTPNFTSSFSDLAEDVGLSTRKDDIVVEEDGTISTLPPPTLETVAAQKVVGSLPIYNESFETSSGITTLINMYVLSSDPADTIRVEIYTIDVSEEASNAERNPHGIAFKESFEWAEGELAKFGVSMKDMNVIFGTRDSTRKSANYWIKTYNLL